MSLLEKMRGDKKGWYKVSDMVKGVEIAVPSKTGEMIWDEIVSIKPVGREHVYDIEVEGTHNFVGNGIFAHNTYVLRANTMLAVTGEVNAVSFVVPIGSATSATSTSALGSEIPPEVLTVDGLGVDLYKLATYNLAVEKSLDAKVEGQGVRITSLESRMTSLESGAISSASGSPISLSTTSLASALNSFGAFISQGFAQFGTLIADRFVAATNSAGQSSAGTVTILTGNTVAQVTNAYVKPSSKIFVTFNSEITGSWWVSDKADGSFRVVLSGAQASDVSFDYFLVQTEGQIATSTSDVGTSYVPTSGSGTVAPVIVTPPADASTTPPVATTTPVSTPSTGSGQADTVPPVVTLNGAAAIQITVGDTFTDPGATATDDVDGDLTTHIIVSGTVDTITAGLYSITYSATDAAGNTGSAGRIVTVIAAAPAAASSTPAI
jgi:hypothetical protein